MIEKKKDRKLTDELHYKTWNWFTHNPTCVNKQAHPMWEQIKNTEFNCFLCETYECSECPLAIANGVTCGNPKSWYKQWSNQFLTARERAGLAAKIRDVVPKPVVEEERTYEVGDVFRVRSIIDNIPPRHVCITLKYASNDKECILTMLEDARALTYATVVVEDPKKITDREVFNLINTENWEYVGNIRDFPTLMNTTTKAGGK
jgi:hypothetical protein